MFPVSVITVVFSVSIITVVFSVSVITVVFSVVSLQLCSLLCHHMCVLC